MKFNTTGKEFSLTAVAVILFSCGCGGTSLDSEGRVETSGTVTIDGTPLSQGSILFVDNTGNSAGVGIIKDGAFTMSKSASIEGIQPGSYQVAINSWKVEPGSSNEAGEIIEKGEPAIPLAYMDQKTSKLTAEVPASGTTELTFPLTSKGP